MLTEISEAIVFFCMSGQPVRLPGVGILAPKITKDGVYGLNFKMDAWLKSEMNVKGKFKGRLVNRDMIGKSVDEPQAMVPPEPVAEIIPRNVSPGPMISSSTSTMAGPVISWCHR